MWSAAGRSPSPGRVASGTGAWRHPIKTAGSSPQQSGAPVTHSCLPVSTNRKPVFGRSVRAVLASAVLGVSAAAALSTAGCSYEDPDKAGPIVQLEAPSFMRAWTLDLKLRSGERVKESFVRGDWLFFYTNKGWLHGVKRATGQYVFGTPVAGAKYKLYAPVLLTDYVAIPTTNTVELFKLNGEYHRSIDVRAAVRADCVGANTSLYVPVDSPNGGARIKKYDVLNEATHIPEWELMTIEGGTAGAAALYNDGIYMAASNGDVYALAGTREPLWPLPGNIFKAQAGIIAPVFADEGGVYVGTTAGKFYCLGLTSGQVRWQYFGKSPVEKPPVVMKDTVYIYDPLVGWIALDKVESPDAKRPQFNRDPRWISQGIAQIVAQDDLFTYVRTTDGRIAALDKKTGQQRFEANRRDLFQIPTNYSNDGIVYHVTERGTILAMKAVTDRGQFGETAQAPVRPQSVLLAAR
jgi:outer membrane protein assembly factor BamB